MLLLFSSPPPPASDLDIEFRYSGGLTNYDPHESFGGAMSSYEITGANLENLFDYISQESKVVGATDGVNPGTKDYRVIYVKIGEASTGTGANGRLWMSENSSISALSYRLAVGSLNTEIGKAATENIIPPGLTFSTAPTSQGTGLVLPNATAGDYFAIAIERSIAATNDIQTLKGPTFTVYWD
jgi:hypothetical protein